MFIAEGEKLCLEGERASTLFVVKSGTLIGKSITNPSEGPMFFQPGSIIGEMSLLENRSREFTITADEDSELVEIGKKELQIALQQKPTWINSMLQFLANRVHIAEENKKKSDLIQALPSLLYVLSNSQKDSESNGISIAALGRKAANINGTTIEETIHILKMLEDLDVLRIENDFVRARSKNIISMLYETLSYRAINKKVSPNILSMTDQMVLTVFVEAAKKVGQSLPNDLFAVAITDLKAEAKTTMHGLTLTTRSIANLVQKNILEPSQKFDIHAPIESIARLYGNMDTLLDLLELNRVFPLLDKKLIQ